MIWLYLLSGAGCLAILAILSLLAFCFMQEIGCRLDRKRSIAIDRARKQVFAEIKSASWWFSEDVPTMNAIAGLADDHDIYGVRERWRKERAKEPE